MFWGLVPKVLFFRRAKMIRLYCRADCPRCNDIVDVLQQLAVAFDVVEVAPGEVLPAELPEGAQLPMLADAEEAYQGSGTILDHLEQMKDFKALWYKYQSDACYCEE